MQLGIIKTNLGIARFEKWPEIDCKALSKKQRKKCTLLNKPYKHLTWKGTSCYPPYSLGWNILNVHTVNDLINARGVYLFCVILEQTYIYWTKDMYSYIRGFTAFKQLFRVIWFWGAISVIKVRLLIF